MKKQKTFLYFAFIHVLLLLFSFCILFHLFLWCECVIFTYIITFFQNIVYPRSTVGHMSIGASALLAVVYALRWELRPLIEKILDSTASFMSKFLPVGKRHLPQVTVVDGVRKILYNS